MGEALDWKSLRFALQRLHPKTSSLSLIRREDTDRYSSNFTLTPAPGHQHAEFIVRGSSISKEVIETFPELTRLTLQNVFIDRDAVPSIASKLRHVEHLLLDRTGVFDDGAKVLAAAITPGALQSLSVKNNKLSRTGIETLLGQQQQLTQLDVSGNPLEESGLRWLLRALPRLTPELELLGLGGFFVYGFADHIDELNDMDLPLRSLQLSGNGLKSKHVERIREAYPDLVELDVRDNSINRDGVTALARASNDGLVAQTENNPGMSSWPTRLIRGVVSLAIFVLGIVVFERLFPEGPSIPRSSAAFPGFALLLLANLLWPRAGQIFVRRGRRSQGL